MLRRRAIPPPHLLLTSPVPLQVIIECAAVYDREEHEIEVEAFAEAVIGYLKNKGVDLADPDWALGAPRRPMRRKASRADTGAVSLASDAARAPPAPSLLPYQATSRFRFRRSTSPSARSTTTRRTPT